MAQTTLEPAATESPRRSRALLPERIRAQRRPRWWQELAFIAICYELYSLVRNAVPDQEGRALHRAVDLLSFEQSLHINVERTLNGAIAHSAVLANICDYYYATLHFAITIAVMVWLYRRHPLRYRALRTVVMATTLVGLVGFWLFALAPPRMLAARGFIDPIVTFHTWGSWGSSGIDSASNQFAAMPSLHIAWSLWCATVLVRLARRRWVKVLAAVYPVATLFVILATANHFLLDAVGGALAVVIGFAAQRALSGRPAFAGPPVQRRIDVPRQSKNAFS